LLQLLGYIILIIDWQNVPLLQVEIRHRFQHHLTLALQAEQREKLLGQRKISRARMP
jgi:hypothetical protein